MTSGDEPQTEQTQVQQQEAPLDLSQVKNIYLVDMSEDKKADMTELPVLLEQAGIDAQIKDYGSDFDSAAGDCDGSADTLMIVTQQKGKRVYYEHSASGRQQPLRKRLLRDLTVC